MMPVTVARLTPSLDFSGALVELGAEVSGLEVVGMFLLNQHGVAAGSAVIAADLLAVASSTASLTDATASSRRPRRPAGRHREGRVRS